MKLVLTTFANEDDAARVIRTVVKEKLAACGTIVPGARSIYQWEGKLEDTTESLALLKTSVDKAAALEERLSVLHPYGTPEILTLAPEKVSAAYAAWVKENCA